MAELARPPNPGRELLSQNEALQKYHALLAIWFEQVADAVNRGSLKDNLGVSFSDALFVTAGAGGALGQQAFIPTSTPPLVVLYRAEQVDASKRPTGPVVCGGAAWEPGATSGSGDGLFITTASNLTSGVSYNLTALLFPG